MRFIKISVLASIVLFTASAFAVPPCLDNSGRPLSFEDQQVLSWKSSTPNGWSSRAYIDGVAIGVYADQTGHAHFLVQIGQTASESVEIVYNLQFGALPQLQHGMQVTACGDFINSFAQNGPYAASPAGAIIHWVHVNPSHQGHQDGFLTLNGTLYGDGPGH